jgi:hypothetical protein
MNSAEETFNSTTTTNSLSENISNDERSNNQFDLIENQIDSNDSTSTGILSIHASDDVLNFTSNDAENQNQPQLDKVC